MAKRLGKIATTDWLRANIRGETAWVDAIMEAHRWLGPVHSTDVICVVTDGIDNASKTKPQEVIKALLARDTRLFGFLIDVSPVAFDSEEVWRPRTLEDLVGATGGSAPSLFYQISHSPGTVSPEAKLTDQQRQFILSYARSAAQEISEFYKLNVKLPARLTKPEQWELEVVDSNGKKDEHMQLFYPHRLAACD